MAFGDDIETLRKSLLALVANNRKVKTQPAPDLLVMSLADSYVALQLRCWVQSRDYPAVHAELLESILGDFSRRGVRLPLPQREVHVFHHGNASGDTPGEFQDALKPVL